MFLKDSLSRLKVGIYATVFVNSTQEEIASQIVVHTIVLRDMLKVRCRYLVHADTFTENKIMIYIHSFSRRFYPNRLPRESFTKVHRTPKTLRVGKT